MKGSLDTESERQKSPLAEFIIKRRQELALNQLQLSHSTGISSGTIASIESGYSQAPKAETLQKLAKGLKVSYQELDCIVRGLEYTPEQTVDKEPLREFELFLMNHPKIPKAVSEIVIEMVQNVVKKYE